MSTTPFAIVGGGWRAEFYLRVAAALPERFRVTGLFTRDAVRRADLGPRFGIKTVGTLADAAQDHYLGLCIEQAARTGRAVSTTGHVWDHHSKEAV